MLCRRTEVFPVECVVRGYLTGSAWKEYRERGTLAGEPLPPGSARERPLRPAALLARDQGGDGPRREHPGRRGARVDSARTSPTRLERLSRLVYARGRDLAAARGIIIADTKFEFGRDRDGDDPPDRRSADAGQLALLARRAAMQPGGRSRASTSSRCATISTASDAPAAGMARPRRRRLPADGRRARRARATSTPSGASPARRSTSATSDPPPVSFAREGLVFIAIAALIAAGTFALALNRRSWPLWLLAFLLTIIALWVAYFFRDPERTGRARRPARHRARPTARWC